MEKREMDGMVVKPGEAAQLLGLSVKSLQRLDREGILKARRTKTNRRYYTFDQIFEFRGDFEETPNPAILGMDEHQANAEAVLLSRNIDRMFFTNDLNELNKHFSRAIERLSKVYGFHKNRIETAVKEEK